MIKLELILFFVVFDLLVIMQGIAFDCVVMFFCFVGGQNWPCGSDT